MDSILFVLLTLSLSLSLSLSFSIEIAEAVVQRNLRPQIPDYVPEGVKTIIEECWAQEEGTFPNN